jgi:hypothetical protein
MRGLPARAGSLFYFFRQQALPLNPQSSIS